MDKKGLRDQPTARGLEPYGSPKLNCSNQADSDKRAVSLDLPLSTELGLRKQIQGAGSTQAHGDGTFCTHHLPGVCTNMSPSRAPSESDLKNISGVQMLPWLYLGTMTSGRKTCNRKLGGRGKSCQRPWLCPAGPGSPSHPGQVGVWACLGGPVMGDTRGSGLLQATAVPLALDDGGSWGTILCIDDHAGELLGARRDPSRQELL